MEITEQKFSIIWKSMELSVNLMLDGSNQYRATYSHCLQPFVWAYGETEELALQALKDLVDREYPFTLYELIDGGRSYKSTDITDINELAISLNMLGEVMPVTRVSYQHKLQRVNG